MKKHILALLIAILALDVSITYGQSGLNELYAQQTTRTSRARTVIERKVELHVVLKRLEEHYKVSFMYSADIKDQLVIDKFNTSIKNLPEQLDVLMEGTDLNYKKIEKNFYVITKNHPTSSQENKSIDQKEEVPLVSNTQEPEIVQDRASRRPIVLTIQGKVLDDAGTGIPGVNVLLKGTTIGTSSDVDGAYALAIPEDKADGTLIFSFIGYRTKEESINRRTLIDVTLAYDVTQLSEVVVVGYGEQKKSLVTGSISSVKEEDLRTVSSGRIDQALQGRTAGVNIIPTSGSPGSAMKIRIRGTSSNGSSDPLYIIDGVRSGAGGIDYLSPSEIASIEVLKDAASAAIYGAEGANGVIIITTKKGKPNTSEITYSSQMGAQSLRPGAMNMMDASQYQQYMTEAGVSNAPPASAVTDPKGTDWFNEVFKTAPLQNHSITFSNGTDKSKFFIAGTYYKQEGIAGGNKSLFNRYTVRVNSDHKLKNWLMVGENFSYSNTVRKGVPEDSEFGSLMVSAIGLDPITPVSYTGTLPAHVQSAIAANQPLVKDANGNYYGISNYVKGEYGNPVMQMDLIHSKTIQNKVLGNFFVEVAPVKALKITSRFGVDAAFQDNHTWNPTFFSSNERSNGTPTASDAWNKYFTWQWENFASYEKTVNDHHFAVLAGSAIQQYTRSNVNGSYSGLFRQEDKWSYADNVADASDRIGSSQEIRSLASFYGRLSYDYQNKYMVNATLRRDGSSMLSDNNKWATFPSVSLGWVASNEKFFPATSGIISYTKLRMSWGQNGSLSNLSPGQWQSSISNTVNGIIRYPNALGTYVPGAAPRSLENPDLKWETSQQIDIGADFGFFNDQLTVTVDYFRKKTKDLITPGTPPGFVGNSLPFVNGGDVENKGFEFEVAYRKQKAGGLQYQISANLTTLSNKVTYLDPKVQLIQGATVGTNWGGATIFRQGYPIWYFNGYKTDGIFQTQEQVNQFLASGVTGYTPKPGDAVIVDTNGDKQISPADQTYIGKPFPDFYFGTRVNLSYKGFDFLMFIQGQVGNDILMGFNRTDRATANKPAFFYDNRWTGPGSTNTWFAANTTGSEVYSSDFMIFKGSFARVRQMQLGYTLPKTLTGRANIKNVRVYISLDNFITITRYPGLDPEAGSSNDKGLGIDRGIYPVPRTVLGGLSFSF